MEQAVQTFRNLRKGLIQEPSKDLLLALLIAIIGLTGSYLVLGKSILTNSENSFESESNLNSSLMKSNESWLDNSQRKVDDYHVDYLNVQGSLLVGSVVRIANLVFNPEKNYRIDFGNGIQHPMTSQVMSMRYTSPGIYLIQCYQLIDGKWELIAANSINIKDSKNKSY